MISSQADSRTIQQARPPFLPLLILLNPVAGGTEQAPNREIFFPPGSLPHFLNSQQFNLLSLTRSPEGFFFNILIFNFFDNRDEMLNFLNQYNQLTLTI